MCFDGGCSKTSSKVEIVFISPSKTHIMFSYRLEFDCTNNVVEYEALALRLDRDLSKGIQYQKIVGDSNLIVSQVKGSFSILKMINSKGRKIIYYIQ